MKRVKDYKEIQRSVLKKMHSPSPDNSNRAMNTLGNSKSNKNNLENSKFSELNKDTEECKTQPNLRVSSNYDRFADKVKSK
jgi:hypothetical protein